MLDIFAVVDRNELFPGLYWHVCSKRCAESGWGGIGAHLKGQEGREQLQPQTLGWVREEPREVSQCPVLSCGRLCAAGGRLSSHPGWATLLVPTSPSLGESSCKP